MDIPPTPGPTRPDLRRPWSRSNRRLPRLVVRPLQAFLQAEISSGVLLLAAAAAALAWANSPWAASYEAFWTQELQLRLGSLQLSEDLRHWVNDGLMALFFFVAGLEIKREVTTGDLSDRRAMAFPMVAAVGGMIVPALLYLAVNAGQVGQDGWGIPMATDIAFALGVVALVGRGLPSALRAFLLTLAIVDDIGAILVIALVYTREVEAGALLVAGALLGVVVVLRWLHVRFTPVYVLVGIGIWLAMLQSGVHATIAGVALGLLTPARPFQHPDPVSEIARRVADETADDPDPPDADADHWLALAGLSREAVSPLVRLEHLLHPWTTRVIIPVFALANAGVSLSGEGLAGALSSSVVGGVVAGLVLGKPLGITLAAWLGSRTGLLRIPPGVRWSHVVGVSAVAGVGFTVSLFIADLAFTEPELAQAARTGILAASVAAALLGAIVLGLTARRRAAGDPDIEHGQAEPSEGMDPEGP
jgi:NhaA family Na+:H+ antiporter